MNSEKLRILNNVGIFLLGLGVLLISIILYKMYLKSFETYQDPLYSYCEGNYIIIKAVTRNLINVSILYNNKTICYFEEIKKGFSKICNIKEYIEKNIGEFVLSEKDYGEKVIFCYRIMQIKD